MLWDTERRRDLSDHALFIHSENHVIIQWQVPVQKYSLYFPLYVLLSKQYNNLILARLNIVS